MQYPTLQNNPVIHASSRGMNDQTSVVKLSPGFVPFAFNFDPDSNVWNRRAGRDLLTLLSGNTLGIFNLVWDDGSVMQIGQFGDTLYNLSTTFDFLFDTGIRWLQQSPDLNWWNITPDATTGAINPTVVAAPATTISSDFLVTKYQLFGFKASATKIWRVRRTPSSLVREPYPIGTGLTTYSTDRAFVTGVGTVLQDLSGNSWRVGVNNAGTLTYTTV